MSFTVEDFQDLIRLLEQHPEWRAELRRHVLSEELLELPALVRQLAEQVQMLVQAQARTEEQVATLAARVDQLAEAQVRTEAALARLAEGWEQRFERLVERMDQGFERVDQRFERVDQRFEQVDQRFEQVDQRFEQVDQRFEQVDRHFERVDQRFDRVDARIGELQGGELERHYERQAPAYFGHFARGLRLVDKSALADLLDEAEVSERDRREVLAADLVLAGRRREDGLPIYLVVEVSIGVGAHDVERAAGRAGILREALRALRSKKDEVPAEVPVLPIVAGRSADRPARDLVPALGVWQILDGHVTPPAEP